MSLTPEEEEELALLEAEEQADPAWRAASRQKQDAARREGPTTGQKAKAFVANAANALTPDTSNAGLGLTAAVLPTSLPILGAMRLGRDALDVDDALERVSQDAPEAALAGALGGGAAGVAIGGKSAGVSRASNMGSGARSLMSLFRSRVGDAGDAAKAAGSGFAEGAVQGGLTGGVARAVQRGAQSLVKGPDELLQRLRNADPAAYGAADDAAPILTGAPTPKPPPVRFTAPVDDVRAPPAPPPTPRPDMPADVMAGGAPRTAAPSSTAEARTQAIDEVLQSQMFKQRPVTPAGKDIARADPEFLDAVDRGTMTAAQAAAATRAQAARATGSQMSGSQMREAVRDLIRREKGIAQNPQKVARTLGISVADAKREINNVAWGR